MRYSRSFRPASHASGFRADPYRGLTVPQQEAKIRAGLRDLVRAELKFTTKGKRGEGKTHPPILARIRSARRGHTASIERQRAHEALTAQQIAA